MSEEEKPIGLILNFSSFYTYAHAPHRNGHSKGRQGERLVDNIIKVVEKNTPWPIIFKCYFFASQTYNACTLCTSHRGSNVLLTHKQISKLHSKSTHSLQRKGDSGEQAHEPKRMKSEGPEDKVPESSSYLICLLQFPPSFPLCE